MVSASKMEIISITKTLLTAKGRTFLGGAFCLAKGKAFETGGPFWKSWKYFLKPYSYTIGYLQKDLKRLFQKNCKNKLNGANSDITNGCKITK